LLFDVIFINGALHEVSSFLFDQLDNKGRLIVLEPLKGLMQLTLYTKSIKGIAKEELLTAEADFLY
jgi:protein-L-isoaspartate O-methyltransferase